MFENKETGRQENKEISNKLMARIVSFDDRSMLEETLVRYV